MHSVSLSPSYTLQNEKPLSVDEIHQFTQLFNQLVLADAEIVKMDAERGGRTRAIQIVKESSESFRNLVEDEEINAPAIDKLNSLQDQDRCPDLDRKFNQAQQKFLHAAFNVVQTLRSRKEYIAWECEMKSTIDLLEVQSELLQSLIEQQPDMKALPGTLNHLKQEIEEHKDHSAELFMRAAYQSALSEHKPSEDPGSNLYREVSLRCVQSFEAFKSKIGELNKTNPVFPEGYRTFALSLKDFGLAFKNFKAVATTFTKVTILMAFSSGQPVRMRIPDIEL